MSDRPPELPKDYLRGLHGPGLSSKRWVFGLSFWTMQIGGWAFFSLLPLGVWMTHVFPDPMMRLVFLIRPVTGFAITCALRPLCGWVFRKKWSLGLLFVLSLLASVIIGSVELAGTLWIANLLGVQWDSPQTHGLVSAMLLMRSGLLFLWFVLYFSLKNLRRSVELESRNREAELALLRSQVNPHFLFNALTTIIEVGRENAQVVALTQSLSEYLRFSLIQGHGEGLYPMNEELDALKAYLEVEKARFEGALEYGFEVEEEARKAPVPSALIQPLLENAIKYGQRTSPRPLRIRVSAAISGGNSGVNPGNDSSPMLQVSVSNTGSWVDPDDARSVSNSLGTGISNLRRRLQLIYGDEASLNQETREAGWVTFFITLPIRSGGVASSRYPGHQSS
jgi:hypothetical protein